jgi:hypothetical protein
MSDARRSLQPHDRLTRLADAGIKAIAAHAEHGDAKVVIFLDSDSEDRGGMVLHGYDSDAEAVADVLLHVRAIMQANGKDLLIGALGRG